MREVNFSVPSSNRASVGITTALYDRRALDCTSTLPLINSLNHLAYLTTSSARIREILTVDGGIERLVNILKTGRNKDMLDTWKWNLAFQCLVNVGVRGSDGKGGDSRGSENIRTRVVEADIVPVVATILDNYIQMVDGIRSDKVEEDLTRNCSRFPTSRRQHTRPDEHRSSFMASRSDRRREAPPPLSIPAEVPRQPTPNNQSDAPPASRRVVPSSPPHDHHWSPQRAQPLPNNPHAPAVHELLAGRQHNRHESAESQASQAQAFDIRLRASTWAAPGSPRPSDAHLIPPMTAGLHNEASSQPDTPTTPRPAHHAARVSSPDHLTVPHRPGIRRHVSMSGLSDDDDQDPVPPETRQQQQQQQQPADDRRNGPAIGLTEEMDIEQLADRASILDGGDRNDNLVPNVAGEGDLDALDLARGALDAGGSIIEQVAGAAARAEAAVGLSPATQFQDLDIRAQAAQLAAASPINRGATPVPGSMPQEGDVILSLQLLAYVSKYCHLRNYFQQCHLVPRLKIQNEVKLLTGNAQLVREVEEEDDNEFCAARDYNIFPLVEKFTVRNHPSEMRYWAGVVMRNLCRKDKSRGDIRQCAYYKCGKWEGYPREFAKCRRCRQTKYCSKECQKSAWAYHRHWCQVPTPSTPGGGSEAR